MAGCRGRVRVSPPGAGLAHLLGSPRHGRSRRGQVDGGPVLRVATAYGCQAIGLFIFRQPRVARYPLEVQLVTRADDAVRQVANAARQGRLGVVRASNRRDGGLGVAAQEESFWRRLRGGRGQRFVDGREFRPGAAAHSAGRHGDLGGAEVLVADEQRSASPVARSARGRAVRPDGDIWRGQCSQRRFRRRSAGLRGSVRFVGMVSEVEKVGPWSSGRKTGGWRARGSIGSSAMPASSAIQRATRRVHGFAGRTRSSAATPASCPRRICRR